MYRIAIWYWQFSFFSFCFLPNDLQYGICLFHSSYAHFDMFLEISVWTPRFLSWPPDPIALMCSIDSRVLAVLWALANAQSWPCLKVTSHKKYCFIWVSSTACTKNEGSKGCFCPHSEAIIKLLVLLTLQQNMSGRLNSPNKVEFRHSFCTFACLHS